MTSERRAFGHRGPFRGVTRVPGDKSLSHRALIFGALANGTSQVSGLSNGDDVVRTRQALAQFGIDAAGDWIVGGRERFNEPSGPIDVGNSGTGMRLLTGLAAGFPFLTVLVGDASVQQRPMDRVVTPLVAMGAQIDGRQGGTLAPLCVRGGSLHGVDYQTPVPSAQVKGAILLAGTGAKGPTTVREQVATRPHTEELFTLANCPPEVFEENGQHVVRLQPRPLSPFSYDVPGDPSQAAFLAVAASIVSGSSLTIEHVYVGPGRAGFIGVLERMGARIALRYHDEVTADLVVEHASLHGTDVEGAEVVSLIDEIPILAVAAAFANGTTTFRDAAELRVKESDRIVTMTSALQAIGALVEERPDGFVVHGPLVGRSATIASAGDHRVAMALAVAALAMEAEVEIAEFDAVATSWPDFTSVIEQLT